MKHCAAGMAAAVLLGLVGCRSPLDRGLARSMQSSRPSKSVTEIERPGRGSRHEVARPPHDDEPSDAPAARRPPTIELASVSGEDLEWARRAEAGGQMAEAEMFYQRVLDRDPTNAEAHHRLAVLADQRGDYATSEAHYRSALDGKPTDPNLLSDIGVSAFLQRRMEDAQYYLGEALRYDSQHKRAQFLLGKVYAATGRPAEAVAMFRLAGAEDEARMQMARMTAPASAPPSQPAPAEGPPPGTDPTQWLREQMDRAKAEALAQRTARPPQSLPQEGTYSPARLSAPPNGWNAEPRVAMRPDPAVHGAFAAAGATHGNAAALPPLPAPAPLPNAAAPPISHAPAAAEQWATNAPPPPAEHWRGPQITPGQRTQPFRDDANSWSEPSPPAVAAASNPAVRDPAVNPAVFAEAGQSSAPHEYRRSPAPQQAPVASWDTTPNQWPQEQPAPPAGGTPVASFNPPPWPGNHTGVPSSATGNEVARAAQLGMQAGPGGLFPTMNNEPATAADPLERFQSSVRRQQDELDQVRRQMEAARQLPPSAAVPRPQMPQGYNSQPPQWPQYTPTSQNDRPPYNPQAGASAASPAPARGTTADAAPPPYNPGSYSPPPYPGAPR